MILEKYISLFCLIVMVGLIIRTNWIEMRSLKAIQKLQKDVLKNEVVFAIKLGILNDHAFEKIKHKQGRKEIIQIILEKNTKYMNGERRIFLNKILNETEEKESKMDGIKVNGKLLIPFVIILMVFCFVWLR